MEFAAGLVMLGVNIVGGWTLGWTWSIQRLEPKHSATYIRTYLIDAIAYGVMAAGNILAGMAYDDATALVIVCFGVLCAGAAALSLWLWWMLRHRGRRRTRRAVGEKTKALLRRLVETLKARPARPPLPA